MAILLVVAKEQTTLPKACNAIKRLEKKLDKLAQNLGQKLENLTALISKTPVSYTHLTLPTKRIV